MAEGPEHTVASAREAAARAALARGGADFLGGPGSDNPGLAQMLSEPPRWWLGPVELPRDQLNRLAGPPDAPVLCPVDEDEWRDAVEELAGRIRDGLETPTVLVSYRDAELVVVHVLDVGVVRVGHRRLLAAHQPAHRLAHRHHQPVELHEGAPHLE